MSVTIALLVSVGCGGQRKTKLEFVDVEGVVKINGQPAGNILVKFVPDMTSGQSCPASSGETDENGVFTLNTLEGFDGAVEGKYLVTLVDLSEENLRGSREEEEDHQLESPVKKTQRIPPKYMTISSSSPLVVVRDGGEPIVIEVSK